MGEAPLQAVGAYAAAVLASGVGAYASLRGRLNRLAGSESHREQIRVLGEAALRLRRPDFELLMFMGAFYALQNDYPRAHRLLQRACVINPEDWRPYRGLFELFYTHGRLPEALAAAKRAAALAPQRAELYLLIARVHESLGALQLAIAAVGKAIGREPGDAASHFELSKLLWRAGDQDGARAALREAARLQPGEATPWGTALRESRDPNEEEPPRRGAGGGAANAGLAQIMP